ncbi:Maf family protein [Eionea flava]
MRIYLASQSPRRRELLEQIGISYEVLSVDVEELRLQHETPAEYVQRLSLEKAKAGVQYQPEGLVLGADTIVVLNDKVLEKPCSEQHGVEMLLQLSGNTHEVMTAVSLVRGKTIATRLNTTTVRFRPITESEARLYWQTGEPQDKAGGYGIQGRGAVFVEEISGSYSSVVGLPLFETAQLINLFSESSECTGQQS